jgi:exosortase
MGLAALAIAASWPVWEDIAEVAIHNEEQSHILLAPVIAAWLVWVRRARLRYCRPDWTMAGPALAVAGWALAVFGFGNAVDVALHAGAILMVAGAALTVLGLDFLRAFAPAVLSLVFLMPIPGRIRHPIAVRLQEHTAQIGQYAMELFGVPVTRAGSVLHINGQDVAVAEACNGMRMVAALVLVSFAFVFSVPMRNGVRVFILALSPVIALLVNVIRLIPTVLLYGYADPRVAEGFHDVSGWAMLLVALGALWAVLGLLRWLEVPIAPYSAVHE